MFNSSVLDVAIGLVFVFLLLSIIASAVKEGLEAIFKRRATELEKGIKELIGADGSKFVESLYNHGLINSLFVGKYGDKKTELPSYIPSKNFALALLDVCTKTGTATPAIKLPSNVDQALNAFKMSAGQDVEKLRKQVEDWYDSSMDRVSGWYKRRTQWWIFGIGLFIAISVNADTVTIARRLSNDKTLREAAVQAAQEEQKRNPTSTANQDASAAKSDTTGGTAGDKISAGTSLPSKSIETLKANVTQLDGLGLPIGWAEDWRQAQGKPNTDVKIDALGQIVLFHFPGWLLTALAISLGAPFWFDLLNKIMVVRSTVKPSEKSKPEGSKDAA